MRGGLKGYFEQTNISEQFCSDLRISTSSHVPASSRMKASVRVRTVIAQHSKGRAGQTEPQGRPADDKRGLYSKVDIIYLIRRCLYPSLGRSLLHSPGLGLMPCACSPRIGY